MAMVISSLMSTIRSPHILLPKEETPSGTRDAEEVPPNDLDFEAVLQLLPLLLSLCSLFSSIAHPPLPPKGEYPLLGTEDPVPFRFLTPAEGDRDKDKGMEEGLSRLNEALDLSPSPTIPSVVDRLQTLRCTGEAENLDCKYLMRVASVLSRLLFLLSLPMYRCSLGLRPMSLCAFAPATLISCDI